jgi:hypothetical protein
VPARRPRAGTLLQEAMREVCRCHSARSRNLRAVCLSDVDERFKAHTANDNRLERPFLNHC